MSINIIDMADLIAQYGGITEARNPGFAGVGFGQHVSPHGLSLMLRSRTQQFAMSHELFSIPVRLRQDKILNLKVTELDNRISTQ